MDNGNATYDIDNEFTLPRYYSNVFDNGQAEQIMNFQYLNKIESSRDDVIYHAKSQLYTQ